MSEINCKIIYYFYFVSKSFPVAAGGEESRFGCSICLRFSRTSFNTDVAGGGMSFLFSRRIDFDVPFLVLLGVVSAFFFFALLSSLEVSDFPGRLVIEMS